MIQATEQTDAKELRLHLALWRQHLAGIYDQLLEAERYNTSLIHALAKAENWDEDRLTAALEGEVIE